MLKEPLNRRRFIKLSVSAALSAAIPGFLPGSPRDMSEGTRSLSLYNSHTLESLTTPFWEAGEYLPGALEKINHLLRDRRTGDIKAIDTTLLDLLFNLARQLQIQGPFHVICGYRSPQTNEILRKRGVGVAKNSLHMFGQAVDIRVPGYGLSALRREAMALKAGGVGYYPRSNFIHVDTGPCRCW